MKGKQLRNPRPKSQEQVDFSDIVRVSMQGRILKKNLGSRLHVRDTANILNPYYTMFNFVQNTLTKVQNGEVAVEVISIQVSWNPVRWNRNNP